MPRKVRRTRHWVVVAASMAVSAIMVVLLLNLTLGGKKGDTLVDHLYGVEDEQFIRTNDLKRARRISLEEWRDRPWTQKVWEHAAGLTSSQL